MKTRPDVSEPTISHQAAAFGNGHDRNDESPLIAQHGDDIYYFFAPEAAAYLRTFTYKGEDRSLLYKFVLSPLADACVQGLPIWVAPNVITLVGLIFMVWAYALEWWYLPDFRPSDSVPRWIFLNNAVCMLLYQTLDNMDGKQARRTNSSSPLGLLFDHGCDAINPIFGSANWILAMALDWRSNALDGWNAYWMVAIPLGLFYVNTWEEYYTGELIMPLANGPSEGLFGGAMVSVAAWYYGPQYWQSTDLWQTHLVHLVPTFVTRYIPDEGLRNCDLLVDLSIVCFLQEVLLKIRFVSWKYGWRPIFDLLPFVTVLSCTAIVARHHDDLWLVAPRTSLHLVGGLVLDMTVDLMVAHMTHQRYQPLRWTLLPLVLLTYCVDGTPWTADALLMYTAALLTYVFYKCTIVIHEMASILNVWCFDIDTPRRSVHDKDLLKSIIANGMKKRK